MAKTPPRRFYDAKDVFRSAIAFNQTCEYLKRINPENEPHIAALIGHPYVAMSALTLELALKTLHALHSEFPVPHHHNLGELFRGLDAKTKRAVQKRWEPIYGEWHERWNQFRTMSYGLKATKNPFLVATALEECSDAFEKSRYNFEDKAQKFDFYVDELRKPLIGLIVERRPDLGVWRFNPPQKMSWREVQRRFSKPDSGE